MTTEKVTVTTLVSAPPADAFEAFTEEIDTWWRRAPRFRGDSDTSIVRFENDHLVEVTSDGSVELGRIVAWEPGTRLVLEWLGAHLATSAGTEVEIRFDADGAGTRITVEHRGWTGLTAGDARSSSIGLWWGDLLATYRHRLAHAA
ncbi:MAG TPA: SRPBCC domain-containing protein [Jiangellaceae bacterium]